MLKRLSARTRATIITAALGGAFLVASPAGAAVVVDCSTTNGKCSTASDGVNFPSGTNQSSVTGTTGNDIQVLFTSVGDTLNTNNGLATIAAFDGVLGNLTIALQGGATFTSALFNLELITGQGSGSNTPSVTFNFSDGTTSNPFALTNGQNQFGVTSGVGISSFTINSTGQPLLGFGDLKQLKFGGLAVSAVPEPSTWALMLLGFGGMGVAMRRRRSTATLAQMA